VPNGTVSNGAESHGTVSNGAESHGTTTNGADEAAEPQWPNRAAVADWEAETGPIPRVTFTPVRPTFTPIEQPTFTPATRWDAEGVRLHERDSDDANGHAESDGHAEADSEDDAEQPSPSAERSRG
jgi:hypothetical protein